MQSTRQNHFVNWHLDSMQSPANVWHHHNPEQMKRKEMSVTIEISKDMRELQLHIVCGAKRGNDVALSLHLHGLKTY